MIRIDGGSHMKQSRKAIVIGGSLGGLVAANLLLRAGWDVHVYERVADELESRGAGIVTHPELMHSLRLAGVVVDDSMGVSIQERVTLGRDGSRVGSRHVPQLFTAWGRLFHALRTAFPNERDATMLLRSGVTNSRDKQASPRNSSAKRCSTTPKRSRSQAGSVRRRSITVAMPSACRRFW